MRKIIIIISLVFILLSISARMWVISKQNNAKQMLQRQQEKYDAGVNKLSQMAANHGQIEYSADMMTSDQLQQEIDKYNTIKEKDELAITATTVGIVSGCIVFSWMALTIVLGRFQKNTVQEETYNKSLETVTSGHVNLPIRTKEEEKSKKTKKQKSKQSKILSNSGWQNFRNSEPDPTCSFTPNADYNTTSERALNVLLCDRQTIAAESRVAVAEPQSDIKTLKTWPEEQDSSGAELENDTQESGPINKTLSELTEQMSAIREYASQQQGKMQKLQEGYDWNIIRTFCLRVIRCIDNLETRIEKVAENSSDLKNLEEVRDELIFALESSGVEQFRPEINSFYRGQEKFAEALKDKQNTDKPDLKGKIANVIRPGYQYVVDDENIKVVRTAQVKLFG